MVGIGTSVGGTIGLGMCLVGSVVMSPSVCSHWKNVRRCLHAVNTVAGVHRVVISARYASTFRCVASSGSQVARNGRR